MTILEKNNEMSLFLASFTKAATGVISAFSTSPIKATGARPIAGPIREADIYGIIHLSGTTSGSVEIALDKNVARQLAANIAICDPSQLSAEDIYDGVGEIINQIVGNTRTILWDNGYKTEISIPVVTGKSNLLESIEKDHPSIYIIEFDCPAGFIALQICFYLINSKQVLAT